MYCNRHSHGKSKSRQHPPSSVISTWTSVKNSSIESYFIYYNKIILIFWHFNFSELNKIRNRCSHKKNDNRQCFSISWLICKLLSKTIFHKMVFLTISFSNKIIQIVLHCFIFFKPNEICPK